MVSRIALTILIALFIAVPALNVFRGGRGYGNPPATFEPGLWWGPQVSLITPTTAHIEFATIQRVATALHLTNPEGQIREIAGAETYTHIYPLHDLKPGTTYTYRLAQGRWLGERTYTFRTQPIDPNTTVRFVAVGDTGSGSPRQLALIDHIAELAPEFVVIVGDVAYPDGTPAQVRARFTIPWSKIHDSTPIFVTLGNHDVKSDYGMPVLQAISLPTNPVDGSEAFYESTHRSVRLICINAEVDLTPETKQYAWLDHTLGSSKTPWTIVFGHRAIYPGSRSGGHTKLREHLVPLLERHGVDLYLSGHDHVYMRTFPMRDNQPILKEQEPNYHSPSAPIHVVTGGGGKSLYKLFPQPHLAQSIAKDHVVMFVVTPTRLDATVQDAQGRVLDTFSIEK